MLSENNIAVDTRERATAHCVFFLMNTQVSYFNTMAAQLWKQPKTILGQQNMYMQEILRIYAKSHIRQKLVRCKFMVSQ